MTRSSRQYAAKCGAGIATLLLLGTINTAHAQSEPADVAVACMATSNMPQLVCDCIGEDSADLTPEQRGFYVAALTDDTAESTRLRGEMSFEEITEVVTFIRTAPVDCVR